MENKEIIEFWLTSAEEDRVTMTNLFRSGDYAWSLFIGHIYLEKLLKALYCMNVGKDVPLTHDLGRLAAKAGLEHDEGFMDKLDTVTTFNIRARYDDYRREFKQLCTKPYTEQQMRMIEDIALWIKKRL